MSRFFYVLKMKNHLFSICFLLFVLLISCQENKDFVVPKGVIQEDTLMMVLRDIHILDAAAKQNFIPNNADNYNKYREYKFVLEKHKITFERFDSTLSFYTNHAKKFEELYDKLIADFKAEEKEFEKR